MYYRIISFHIATLSTLPNSGNEPHAPPVRFARFVHSPFSVCDRVFGPFFFLDPLFEPFHYHSPGAHFRNLGNIVELANNWSLFIAVLLRSQWANSRPP
jgi:hypothetical protein